MSECIDTLNTLNTLDDEENVYLECSSGILENNNEKWGDYLKPEIDRKGRKSDLMAVGDFNGAGSLLKSENV
ncbi:7627_t:CDS:2 [Diversispora eburnea]|uniref:7627_t:CDS:1 n=1 Tax=Diversispora eburnea TaxID=1213867 RepID=A0A9N8Z7Y6_9GLOM|nr:7627_t:CDS:2 [Diversispora eburnea]